MSLLGPMVVVAEQTAADLVDVLGRAGAFPIVETRWADAPDAVAEIQPSAMLIADPEPPASSALAANLSARIESTGSLYLPVVARVHDDIIPAIPSALPVDIEEPDSRIIARLRAALRVRTMHATILRRARTAELPAPQIPVLPPRKLLDDASVLCFGRGRSYPELTVALGERVGVIGALSVETAARHLNSRDLDGIVIGDGLSARVVEALLTVIAEDPRFRDLPVGVLGPDSFDDFPLPNLMCVPQSPQRLVQRLLPLVQLQAYEAGLRRTIKSLESSGVIDPDNGLLTEEAFWRDLGRAFKDTAETSSNLSVARFAFDGLDDARVIRDAARLFSRLLRNVDLAYQDDDGSIIAAFTETDLRNAHVIARRLAAVLRQTMLTPAQDRRPISPTVTLATQKATDTLSTLMARVATQPAIAAG